MAHYWGRQCTSQFPLLSPAPFGAWLYVGFFVLEVPRHCLLTLCPLPVPQYFSYPLLFSVSSVLPEGQKGGIKCDTIRPEGALSWEMILMKTTATRASAALSIPEFTLLASPFGTLPTTGISGGL